MSNKGKSLTDAETRVAADERKLAQHLFAAQDLVYRSFLSRLESMEVVQMEDAGVPSLKNTCRVLGLTRIVYDNKEDTLEGLLNLYTAVGAAGYSLVLIIQGSKTTTNLYIGVRSDSPERAPQSGQKLLQMALDGHFPGTECHHLRRETIKELLSFDYYGECHPNWSVSALPGIPALKAEEREHFTQGLERFLDAMQGREFAAVILAEPVDADELMTIQSGYEDLSTALSVYAKQNVTAGTNESRALTETLTEGLTDTISSSISRAQTHTEGKTSSTGAVIGAAAAVGLTLATGGAAAPLVYPIASGIGGIMGSKSKSDSDSSTSQEGKSQSKSTQKSEGETSTEGTSKTIGFEQTNRQVTRFLEKIDKHLERLDESRSYGMWESACYFLAEDSETARTAAALYMGNMRGDDSGVEDTAITVWSKSDEKKRCAIREYVQNLQHPRLRLSYDVDQDSSLPMVSPTSLVTGRELALLMHLPRRSVGGASVVESTGFGRDVRVLHTCKPEDAQGSELGMQTESCIRLGNLRHLYKDMPQEVALTSSNMVYHSLVTGTTGTGKTTVVKSILAQCHEQGVPFLVVEPAKNEYSELVDLHRNDNPVTYWQCGRSGPDCLRLNPLVFPTENEAVSLIEHIDRVCALLNAAFPMYAAMPQLLEEAIIMAYERCGWDTITSRCVHAPPKFPTLRDVADLIPGIVEKAGYQQEALSTYVGALGTRLRSLTRGALGLTFMAEAREETAAADLFDTSAIVNLSSVGASEKKAVLMGLLMLRLQEHRLVQGAEEGDQLKHVMVLEEAHNLLRRTSTQQDAESSNPQGQAVESISNALAEMRAYGQAFLIVDQSASALDTSVLKNTNTKVALRAPFKEDREILAGALSLDEKQCDALARLENHTGIVKQNDWLEAVHCHFEPLQIEKRELKGKSADSLRETEDARLCCTHVLRRLLHGRLPSTEYFQPEPDIQLVMDWLEKSVPEESKREAIKKRLIEGRERRRPLSETRHLLLGIEPIYESLRQATRGAATEIGLRNHLDILLEQQTLFQNGEVRTSVMNDLLVSTREPLCEQAARATIAEVRIDV